MPFPVWKARWYIWEYFGIAIFMWTPIKYVGIQTEKYGSRKGQQYYEFSALRSEIRVYADGKVEEWDELTDLPRM